MQQKSLCTLVNSLNPRLVLGLVVLGAPRNLLGSSVQDLLILGFTIRVEF